MDEINIIFKVKFTFGSAEWVQVKSILICWLGHSSFIHVFMVKKLKNIAYRYVCGGGQFYSNSTHLKNLFSCILTITCPIQFTG